MMQVSGLARSALAVFAASTLILASIQTALGSVGYKYAHQWTLSGTNGIDGYIRASGRSSLDNPSDHIAFWMNLGDSVEWIQTGEYQGAIGTISSQSHLDKYAESKDGCGTYDSSDFQAPARPNYAYYITWTGSSSVFSCPWGPLTQYKFEVRFGSLVNPPSGIPRWMPYSANHPMLPLRHTPSATHKRPLATITMALMTPNR